MGWASSKGQGVMQPAVWVTWAGQLVGGRSETALRFPTRGSTVGGSQQSVDEALHLPLDD